MEEWQPLYARNGGRKDIYQEESRRIVREQFPQETNETWIEQEAIRQFEEATR